VKPRRETAVVKPRRETAVVKPRRETAVVKPRREAAVMTPRREAAVVKPSREAERSAHERDLMELLAYCKQVDEQVADALVTLLSRADAHTLAALGVVMEFVVSQLRRRR
jgi:hypothetical protein